jgi:CoA-transferase family III
MSHDRAYLHLMETLGLSISTSDFIEITGQDPVLNTPYLIGEALAGSLGAQAAAVRRIWQMRTRDSVGNSVHDQQQVRIDIRAAVNSASGISNIYQSGHLIKTGLEDDPTFRIYRTLDDKWIFIAGIYPHLRDGLLKLLNCINTQASIGQAIARWDSRDLESAIAENELVGSALRTQKEWRDSLQGKALLKVPVVEIIKIGESDPEKFKDLSTSTKSIRPLSNIRVLDMTRVLAGPLASRLLAEQGADVLHISSPNLPYLYSALLETGFGKRSAFIDLEQLQDVQLLKNLIAGADIFSENYHRSGLAKYGLSPLELTNIRPGIIYVSESAFGEVGPWQNRRGVDQIAQMVTGIAAEMGSTDSPKLFPQGYYFMDYLTGYLAAAGACAALIKRAVEGGSYWVRVSLTQSAMWVQDLGQIDTTKRTFIHDITSEERAKYMIMSESPFGMLKHTAPVAKYSKTPSYFEYPVVPLGAHNPVW